METHFCMSLALHGREAVVLLLLQRGVDVLAKNVAGITPEQYAKHASHPHVFLLIKAEAARRVERHTAFAMGQLERLGAQSWVQGLDADVVRMVLEQV